MEKIMYELLLKALFGQRAPGLGDEYYMAAKKIGYIHYSEFDKHRPELTDKGQEKLRQLKEIYSPSQSGRGKSGNGYEVEVKI
jgi:hypothetical protein